MHTLCYNSTPRDIPNRKRCPCLWEDRYKNIHSIGNRISIIALTGITNNWKQFKVPQVVKMIKKLNNSLSYHKRIYTTKWKQCLQRTWMTTQAYGEWKNSDLNITVLEGNFKNTDDHSGVRSQNSVAFGRREGVLLNVDNAVSLELGGSVHFVMETYT